MMNYNHSYLFLKLILPLLCLIIFAILVFGIDIDSSRKDLVDSLLEEEIIQKRRDSFEIEVQDDLTGINLTVSIKPKPKMLTNISIFLSIAILLVAIVCLVALLFFGSGSAMEKFWFFASKPLIALFICFLICSFLLICSIFKG